LVIDPSAASFIATVRRHGRFSVRKAVNDVLDGIRVVSSMLKAGMVLIHSDCADSIREFGLYSWDADAKGDDKVLKENDHAMDDISYFCYTILAREFKWYNWG
ncbi:MAG: PBSX family phage terminase large subunit, partial [Clostridia bacterium]|nr:PBSX family phage terminase large subunit [Clostridia bacterium]